MHDTGGILRALDELERVQADLARISSRTDDQRRHDLIELRRQLAMQIVEVGRVAEPLFNDLARVDLMQLYRAKFSKMRSNAAIHQANWPAVRLDQADDEYRRSVLAVREANRDFVSWLRETISALGKG